jgi:uncharacterized iron-regulated membrane protein
MAMNDLILYLSVLLWLVAGSVMALLIAIGVVLWKRIRALKAAPVEAPALSPRVPAARDDDVTTIYARPNPSDEHISFH